MDRVWTWGASALIAALALGGAYLASQPDASLLRVAATLIHPLVGLAGIVAGLVAAVRGWRRWGAQDRATAVVVAGACAVGAIAAVLGGARPHQAWMVAHTWSAPVAALALAAALARRRAWAGAVAAAATLAAVPWVMDVGAARAAVAQAPIRNDAPVALSMEEEGDGPDGPFWPSAASTTTGGIVDGDFFMEPERCAGSGCHDDVVTQWRSSAHHFSSFNNPWYRRSIEDMQEKVGTRPSKWCGGCHDHAVLFAGEMDEPIAGRIDTPNAQAGLTCNSCHAIQQVRSTLGNGDFVIEYPALHKLVVSDAPLLNTLHDLVVHLDPEPHRRTFLKPFFTAQSGEYCSTCHKVHLDKPVNGYRWLRGFNEYDGWQGSGVSGQGGRSFYYPPAPMSCRDCHMPLVPSDDAASKDGRIRSHRFAAANTAVPTHSGDQKQLDAVVAFLKAGQVTVDLFALSRGVVDPVAEARGPAGPAAASSFAEGDTLGFAESGAGGAGATEVAAITAPLDRAKPAVVAGEQVRIDAVVRTRGVGHFFPGGTVDGFDVWLELRVVDATGRTLHHSGTAPVDDQGRKGPVDPEAHFYRARLIDEDGRPIDRRNAWQARAVVYVRLIPPGAADTVHFRVAVPEDAQGPLTVTTRLNYRKFTHFLTQHSFERLDEPAPDLPIVVMAQDEVQLEVLPAGAAPPEPRRVPRADDSERWNDYGIGLLLQGDLRGAEEAFLEVSRVAPAWASGWVNIGRARVREGRTHAAEEALQEALRLSPKLAAAHFTLGSARKDVGDYAGALEHFAVVDEQYPRDRVNLNEIAHVRFLMRDFGGALGAARRVLAIDPEDVRAHYTAMLALRGMGDAQGAAREQRLYLRFKADEDSQTRVGPYLREHPHDNNERQAIHEHEGIPADRLAELRAWAP